MRTHFHFLTLASALIGLAACAESPATTGATEAPLAPSAAELGLPYPALLASPQAAAGTARAPLSLGCSSAPFRQFDFWLGDWTIVEPGEVPGGVVSLTSELGGCAFMEFLDGGSGRSISLYDRARGRWLQTYANNAGSLLRLYGRAEGASMVFDDDARARPEQGDVIKSYVTWTPLADGSVQQTWLRSGDGGATYGVLWEGNFRRAAITHPPLPGPSETCNVKVPAFRDADFLLGSWSVRVGGLELGRVRFESTVGGCLIEENFEAKVGGYASRAYVTYDQLTHTWYRLHADTTGFVYELGGGAQNGALALEGEALPGVRVRATWSTHGPNELRQRWEAPGAGGASTTLVLRRTGT